MGDWRKIGIVGVVLSGLAGAACTTVTETPIAPIADHRPAEANVVVDWNVLELRTTAQAPVDPPRESRTLAMVQAAVFDAVNSITGGYRRYLTGEPAPPEASPEAAVAAAAHDVLAAVYPPQRASLDEAYRASLATVPDGPAEDAGIAVGEHAAARILEERAGDGADNPGEQPEDAGLGKWRPTPPAGAPALDPAWGRVRPFVLQRPSQFRPEAPYRLTSEAYARDLSEVKAVGSASSATRTAEQTEAARFWAATASQEWNQLAGQLTAARHLSLVDTARLYAQLNFAEADAAIAAWDTKFEYQQWRPVTGIREADTDGNPATEADSDWRPLLATPPFPDYVCGHSSLAGAAEAIFEQWFGRRPGITLALTSAALPGVTHRYPTFQAVSDEVTNARVWAGVHWRTSCVTGRTLGRSVGHLVSITTLPRRRHR
ncbi:MAG: vanadium-dependent haloperoxidase [Actinobacteria bacterium]|nr:vanadium-dependent haloperoxidase [Actinomycetota bacterium]